MSEVPDLLEILEKIDLFLDGPGEEPEGVGFESALQQESERLLELSELVQLCEDGLLRFPENHNLLLRLEFLKLRENPLRKPGFQDLKFLIERWSDYDRKLSDFLALLFNGENLDDTQVLELSYTRQRALESSLSQEILLGIRACACAGHERQALKLKEKYELLFGHSKELEEALDFFNTGKPDSA